MTAARLGPLVRFLRGAVANDDGDAVLLRRFAGRRDGAAFAELVRRHGPMVYGVCLRVLRQSHDAEDAFQAVFLVLARKAAAVARPESVANWLHGVAYRTALKAKAQRARRRVCERRAAAERPAAHAPASDWADLGVVLDEEINRLPSAYRAAFVLCHLEGKTNEEAARLLGCPRGTVYSRLAEARARLRARLTRRGRRRRK